MKIFISFKMKETPTGGGNQFLRSLRSYFHRQKWYAKNIDEADVVLFNSHHSLSKVVKTKRVRPDCIFIHRIDGPMSIYNRPGDRRDSVAYTAMKQIADCAIFQSEWSRKKNIDLGVPNTKFNDTIVNAPDPEIFNRSEPKPGLNGTKIRLIATSWSANWQKGFDIYQWIDLNLDFSAYEMVFIGNSPIHFRNIRHIPPLNSLDLAAELKNSDIFIAASRQEACSNSLLEALHCGLPVVGPNESSNPGIIGKGGEVFDSPEEIPGLIDKITKSYKAYQERIDLPNIEEIGQSYYRCMHSVYKAVQIGDYFPKRLTYFGYMKVMSSLWLLKLHQRFTGIKNRLVSGN